MTEDLPSQAEAAAKMDKEKSTWCNDAWHDDRWKLLEALAAELRKEDAAAAKMRSVVQRTPCQGNIPEDYFTNDAAVTAHAPDCDRCAALASNAGSDFLAERKADGVRLACHFEEPLPTEKDLKVCRMPDGELCRSHALAERERLLKRLEAAESALAAAESVFAEIGSGVRNVTAIINADNEALRRALDALCPHGYPPGECCGMRQAGGSVDDKNKTCVHGLESSKQTLGAETIRAFVKERDALESFLKEMPCPNSGNFEDVIGESYGTPCTLCGKQWTAEKATRYYHGTALDVFKRKG